MGIGSFDKKENIIGKIKRMSVSGGGEKDFEVLAIPQNQLYIAVFKNHVDEARRILESGCDISKTVDGDLLCEGFLGIATIDGHIEMVELLLDFGLSPDSPWPMADGTTSTPLGLATAFGSSDIATLLLERGANADIQCGLEKNPPLDLAVEKGNVEFLKMLLEHGANTEIENKKLYTPLKTAIYLHKPECLKVLLEYGAKMDGDMNMCPMFVSIAKGFKDCVEILLDHGFDIHKKCRFYKKTPIMLAVEMEKADIIEFLISRGADITEKTPNGKTLLELAKKTGKMDVVNALSTVSADSTVSEKKKNKEKNDSHKDCECCIIS